MTKDRIGGVLLLMFCIAYGVLSQKIPLLPIQAKSAFTAKTLPQALTVLGIALSLMIIVFSKTGERPVLTGYKWPVAIGFLILMSLYGLTIRPFGFIGSTTLFLTCGFALLGERSVVKLLAVALPLVVGFWALLTLGLDIFIEPLPWFLKG